MPKFPCTGNDAPKPIQGFSAETTSGYEPCSVVDTKNVWSLVLEIFYEPCLVADTKTVWSLVPEILFKKIIGLRPKLGNTYYHISEVLVHLKNIENPDARVVIF